jgi:glutamate-1-semialdehyde aminotransferase
VAGRPDVLTVFGDVHISSTYYVNGLSMAASLATLDVLQHTPALAQVRALGERLQRGLREVVAAHDLPAVVEGVPQMPFLRFADQETMRAFYRATIRRGIFLHPNHHWYVSAAMTEQDIDLAVAACRQAAREVREPHRA